MLWNQIDKVKDASLNKTETSQVRAIPKAQKLKRCLNYAQKVPKHGKDTFCARKMLQNFRKEQAGTNGSACFRISASSLVNSIKSGYNALLQTMRQKCIEKIIGYILTKPDTRQKMRIVEQSQSAEKCGKGTLWTFSTSIAL